MYIQYSDLKVQKYLFYECFFFVSSSVQKGLTRALDLSNTYYILTFFLP